MERHSSETFRSSQRQFVDKAQRIHGAKYDYSQVEYKQSAALQKFSHLKYTPAHAFSGKTECFQNDALLTLCEYMDDL